MSAGTHTNSAKAPSIRSVCRRSIITTSASFRPSAIERDTITPILSILKAVLTTEPASEFTLFYGNQRTDSIIFHETIEGLKNEHLGRLSIHHVLTRHEQGAAHMADGYARASGKVGVAMATSGPGATNLVTGADIGWWSEVFAVITKGEMPPPDAGELSDDEQRQLVDGVADADVGLDDAPVVEDQRVGDDHVHDFV